MNSFLHKTPRLGNSGLWGGCVVFLVVALSIGATVHATQSDSDGGNDPAGIEQRLAASAKYLSSDDLEGRGLGTKGIDLAAAYIAKQLGQLATYGVQTDLWDGGPFQKFKVAIDADLSSENKVSLVGPPRADGKKPLSIELELGKDYTPLAISGAGKFDLPLVFAGYGISARKAGYDDFADVNVTDKAVIMLRHQPRDEIDDKESAAIKETAYTAFRHKASNAYEHGASGVIFCCDQAELRRRHSQDDTALSFKVAGTTFTHPDLPVLSCRRAVIDRILKSLNDPELGQIEEQIDRTLKPASRELTGWRLRGETGIHHVLCDVKNVAAILPGEGPLADETVVVGAHYDHLGYGARGTVPSKKESGSIYHGADDNASGVAVVIEVARALSQRPKRLHRRVLFILFTGEEWGFWGSSHYVNNPVVPLEKTVAMLNLDMVGRLREGALTINSVGTGTGLSPLLDLLNRPYGFQITQVPGASGRSDQAAFYAKRVPNIHYFTGKHPDYHRPTDTFPGLNLAGMRRIAGYVADMAVALADAPGRPEFVSVPMQRRANDVPRAYLGCLPDFTREEPGYPISCVISGSPAARCGLQSGDVIVKFGRLNIGIADDLDDALQQYVSGDRVRVKVRRDRSTKTFETVLEATK